MSEPSSAIVVRVALPPALERIRREFDRSAALGVPAHVTILYPWLPAAGLSTAVRDDLRGIVRDTPAFGVRFARVRRWPEVAYLEPEPAEPFATLIARVAARYPEFPPYAGTIAEVVPHLTLVENGEGPLDEVAIRAVQQLPFERVVRSIEVLTEGADGRWRARWRLPFATKPRSPAAPVRR
jgi:2'-5' RNA ligase